MAALVFVFRIWSEQARHNCFKQNPQQSWGSVMKSCGEVATALEPFYWRFGKDWGVYRQILL